MYSGQIVNIPLGTLGLYTDDAQNIMPPQGLIMGENIQVKLGFIEKDPGSRKWNLTPIINPDTMLPTTIMALFDWWPDETTQRAIAVTQDGRVWRFTDSQTFSEVKPDIAPLNMAPAKLNVTIPPVIVLCGREVANAPRKLFIMTGNDPVQVIVGDGTTRHNINLPALDWTGAFQPFWACVFLNRVWAFGNQNFPSMMYASNVDDHEDFQTFGSVLEVNIYPGDSEKLMTGSVYKGRLVVFKHPFGYYFIDTTNPAAPVPQKLGDAFGASSQQSTIQVLDDYWIGNSIGAISSLEATLNLGGLQQDDVVKDMKCFRYLSENTRPLTDFDQRALWYEAKKLAFFTYHSPSGMNIDRIFVIDVQSGQPRPTFNTKDTPQCMALMKDYQLVQRPFYGSTDGYIYQMDQEDRSVGGQFENNIGGHAYTMNFQIPYLDFSFVNPAYMELTKNFDFMEVTFEPTGNWNLSADIFLDNVFVETVLFNLSQSDVMDNTFVLDKSRLSGPGLRSSRRPLHGNGRRISARFYASGLNQNCKIAAVTFYFRLSGNQQRSS